MRAVLGPHPAGGRSPVQILLPADLSRRCHNILAMPESSTACSTMRVLTPAQVRFPCRHPRLLRTAFPTSRPQTHHDALPSFVSPCSTGPVVSRLRHESAGSPKSPRRIGFVSLRAVGSPPVAPHPASRRRSYLRLRGLWLPPARTSTALTVRPRGRTDSGSPCRNDG